jgi:hypothetical protein
MTNKTTKIEELTIEGTVYVPKDSIKKLVNNTEGLPFVIIRTYSAGVHIGYLNKKESTLAGMEVELINTRRIWSWKGANTLTDLAVNGTTDQTNCKITIEAPSIQLVAIEIITVTNNGFNSLNSVIPWK